jgi:nucleoside-diphosphate-sugar epimerase
MRTFCNHARPVNWNFHARGSPRLRRRDPLRGDWNPATKIAAENELRSSGLNWSILRLPFVYGDWDGHLASVPPLIARFKWHPAKTFSLAHHRDLARAVELALTGVMEGRIVNVTDDAPTTLYEMASLVGSSIEPSAEPLTDPWMGRMDGSTASCSWLPPDGSDCVSSKARRNSVTSARGSAYVRSHLRIPVPMRVENESGLRSGD